MGYQNRKARRDRVELLLERPGLIRYLYYLGQFFLTIFFNLVFQISKLAAKIRIPATVPITLAKIAIKKVKNIYPPTGWCSPEFHRRTDLRDRKTVRAASVFGPTPRRPKNVAEQIAFSHLFGNRWS